MNLSQTPTLAASSAAWAETAHLIAEWMKALPPSSVPDWVPPFASDCGHWLLYLLSLRLAWLVVPVVAVCVQQAGTTTLALHTFANTQAASLGKAFKRALCALLERIRTRLSSD